MDNQAKLDESVARVVRMCFPNRPDFSPWRSVWGRYRFAVEANADEFGYCDGIEQVIYVCWEFQTKDELDGTVAHEITHAVCPVPGHGPSFLREYRAAAAIARKHGRLGLAECIENDADQYEGLETESRPQPPQSEEEVYERIEDYVGECRLRVYELVVLAVAAKYNMPPGDPVRQYPRTREVFDSALKYYP